MNPEMKAKMQALMGLKSDASKAMGEKFKPKPMEMKKVSVMADSTKGLKEGLDKAEEVVEEGTDVLGTEGEVADKEAEMDAYVAKLSEKECDMMLEKLMAKKKESESEEESEEETSALPF